MAKTPVVDPWLQDAHGNPDPFAGNVDFSLKPEDAIDPDADPVLQQHEGLDPEIIGPAAPSDETPPTSPAVEPDPEAPEIIDVDGGQATLEKERGQWKLTVTSDSGGQPQVYWGKTKNELFANLAKAQIHATAKIRELNGKVKLGGAPPKPAQPVVVPNVRTLTADENFEIKTQLEANPDLAFSTWFQKKTGRSVEQLVELAQKGANAEINLEMEATSRDFLGRNPDYYPDPANKNFELLVKWIAKFKLGKTATDANALQVMNELGASGNWTVENLEEAFQDLANDGLMISKPKAPLTPTSVTSVTPVVTSQEPAQPAPRPPDERIVRRETRPRAATGIRTADITPVAPPVVPAASSAEDLDNMTDEQHDLLWKAVRRQHIQGRRS